MKIVFNDDGTKTVQISDGKILEFIKKAINFYGNEFSIEKTIIRQEFKSLDDNFIKNIKKYLCWYLSWELSINISNVEVLLEADLEKFVSDPNYAQEIFSENFDVLPEIGLKFWEIPLQDFIDEENSEGIYKEIKKILED